MGKQILGAVRSLKKNAALVVLALALVAAIGGVEVAARNAAAGSSAGSGVPTGTPAPTLAPVKVTCGAPGLPACVMHGGEWIPIKSAAQADILDAMQQTSIFKEDLSGPGDHIHALTHLADAALVRALQPSKGGHVPDFYILPVLNDAGAVGDAVAFELNADHTALRYNGAITYGTPRPALARMSSGASASAVAAQHHTAIRAGLQPYLIFFPVNAQAQQSAQAWKAGGDSPFDPIWLVPGADGKDHVVGADGSVYYTSELPISL